MSRKPLPAQAGERSRAELSFDKPQVLAQLFGQYDRNLVALENRLGVYITARGNRVGLEGTAEQVALARDVLNDLYARIQRGEEIDTGLVDASIAMASEPTLDGILSAERSSTPSVMIRTRKKTIVPRTPPPGALYEGARVQRHDLRARPGGHRQDLCRGRAGGGAAHHRSVQRLILSRPAVEAGEKLGFLPGDMKEKVDPISVRSTTRCTTACPPSRWTADRQRRDRDRAHRLHARAGRWPMPSSSSTRRRTPRPRR